MRVILYGLCAVILSGCAQLGHLQELLAMKTLSENQSVQKKYVKERTVKFQALLKVVHSGEIKNYNDKKVFLKTFGEPIYLKKMDRNGEKWERLFYRYPEKLSGSEKVYVYFDSKEKLVDYAYVPPKAPKPAVNKQQSTAHSN